MKQFAVVFGKGCDPCSAQTEYILATDSEHAAWQALELAKDRDVKLVDVRRYVNFDW